MTRSYSDSVRRIVKEFERSGAGLPATSLDIAAWAMKNRLWEPHPGKILKQCADEISKAMRDEHITDPQGRRVRAKLVATVERNGEQLALWDDIRRADRKHVEVAFQQRRQQIVGDCRHLKTDVDSYNDNRNSGTPIQMVFDFTLDLEELALAS